MEGEEQVDGSRDEAEPETHGVQFEEGREGPEEEANLKEEAESAWEKDMLQEQLARLSEPLGEHVGKGTEPEGEEEELLFASGGRGRRGKEPERKPGRGEQEKEQRKGKQVLSLEEFWATIDEEEPELGHGVEVVREAAERNVSCDLVFFPAATSSSVTSSSFQQPSLLLFPPTSPESEQLDPAPSSAGPASSSDATSSPQTDPTTCSPIIRPTRVSCSPDSAPVTSSCTTEGLSVSSVALEFLSPAASESTAEPATASSSSEKNSGTSLTASHNPFALTVRAAEFVPQGTARSTESFAPEPAEREGLGIVDHGALWLNAMAKTSVESDLQHIEDECAQKIAAFLHAPAPAPSAEELWPSVAASAGAFHRDPQTRVQGIETLRESEETLACAAWGATRTVTQQVCVGPRHSDPTPPDSDVNRRVIRQLSPATSQDSKEQERCNLPVAAGATISVSRSVAAAAGAVMASSPLLPRSLSPIAHPMLALPPSPPHPPPSNAPRITVFDHVSDADAVKAFQEFMTVTKLVGINGLDASLHTLRGGAATTTCASKSGLETCTSASTAQPASGPPVAAGAKVLELSQSEYLVTGKVTKLLSKCGFMESTPGKNDVFLPLAVFKDQAQRVKEGAVLSVIATRNNAGSNKYRCVEILPELYKLHPRARKKIKAAGGLKGFFRMNPSTLTFAAPEASASSKSGKYSFGFFWHAPKGK